MIHVDLFSGIGGFTLAAQAAGYKTIYACEIDKNARKVYQDNFPEVDIFENNIYSISFIPPEPDLLTAGFPCQSFSLAGKRNGFNDARGNIFFALASFITISKPKMILLENVRGLLSHDIGNTFRTIKSILEIECDYTIYYKVIRACDQGLPTFRPRIYIVGFRKDIKHEFSWPPNIPLKFTLSDIFGGLCNKDIGYTIRCGGRLSPLLGKHNWNGYLIDGKERRLSPSETKLMMGFPESFKMNVSDNQAMRLLGNSIAVDVVKRIINQL